MRFIISLSIVLIAFDATKIRSLKADFQSSYEAPRSSLRVDAWALSSNHNAKQLILIRCKHSQRAARSVVRGLEIRLKRQRDLFSIKEENLLYVTSHALKTNEFTFPLDYN
jgi:hypothetical protein